MTDFLKPYLNTFIFVGIKRIILVKNSIKTKNIKGITNLAPSYNKLIITFDLDVINYKELVEKIIDLKPDEISETASKRKKIPICIDEEFALDIERVSKNTNLTIKEVYNHKLKYDKIIFATPPDQILEMLADPTDDEKKRFYEWKGNHIVPKYIQT